jgi:hypothetical protein
VKTIQKTFGAYQSVKVTDTAYERFGQVGVYVGPGDEPGEVAIKFENESGKPGDPQQTDTFPIDAVEAV